MHIHGIGGIVAGAVMAAALGMMAWAPRAQAEERAEGDWQEPVVVELFTSQGCSSCPPADELLRDLAKRDDVLPLALHVDYWDYIGWKDSFARPEHTNRQRAYAAAAGEKMIYTPQMIVGGVTRVVGARAMQVVNALDAHADAPRLPMRAERRGDAVYFAAPAPEADPGPLMVYLVRYMPEAKVDILRGENAGRTLSYANIVTAWDPVAKWAGDAPLELRLTADGPDEAAVIVQEIHHGRIVGAAAAR